MNCSLCLISWHLPQTWHQCSTFYQTLSKKRWLPFVLINFNTLIVMYQLLQRLELFRTAHTLRSRLFSFCIHTYNNENINTLLKRILSLVCRSQMMMLLIRCWFTEIFDDTKEFIRSRHMKRSKYYNVRKKENKMTMI